MAIYKTTKGRSIDVDQFRAANEKEIAAGNMNVNARGDEIRNGKVVKSASKRVKEYYKDNPNAVKNVSIKQTAEEITEEAKKVVKVADMEEPKAKPKAPDEIIAKPKATKKKTKKKVTRKTSKK